MRSKHALAVALVLTVCAVPLTVSAGTPVDDVSPVQLAQSSTTTETMHNGTMDDTMTDDNMSDTTTDDTMNDGESGGSGNSLPGFGIGVALVALVAGALYIARNR
ncbi:hypothetical protein A4G99_03845 [Haladaptatus sp. R4]|uniref:PGF-CTERM sorting domain-containing protein n=1 Tax=Haladaptatus sp. R4 TaxID=1679489 RepID=UPI0007B4AFD2|nr:PGF-CTERM sorting domain-containing protein [Haladaptatus sp. R4]KZN25611.1 hypothetical protein A4G99_03845 [Haladaptatus sp. R4]